MNIELTLQIEIDESKKWLDIGIDDSTYNRALAKKTELINWTLENVKNSNDQICALIESKMNGIIDTINKTYSILEPHKLHSEQSILDWILYQFVVTQ
jgi:hypothetical protein